MHGVVGFALIAVVGAVLTMPAPVAFPLAGSLRQLGACCPQKFYLHHISAW